MLLAMLLPACKSIIVAAPPPTPIPLHLAYTPTLRPWLERLAACAKEKPDMALFLDELPFNQSSLDQYDAVLRLGGGQDSTVYAIVLGYDELKIIVNNLNPVQSIGESALQNLFHGSMRTWETLSPPKAIFVVSIQPWVYLPESELSLPEVIGNTFDDNNARTARLASTPDQVIQGIRDDPGAVGIVPLSWLNKDSEGVKQINMPTAWEIPVLSISKSEPQGALRSLLGCISQERN
jgi:hypothetical protein